MKRYLLPIVLLFFMRVALFSQPGQVSAKSFFNEDNIPEVSLTTDIKSLRNSKSKPAWQPAHIMMIEKPGDTINEKVEVKMRGNVRKQICDIATIEVDFKTPTSPRLSKLKKLKLVGGCSSKDVDEALLLREYLVYKMYNVLSPLSFKVRLLKVTYNDARQKMNSYTQYAFLIEDLDELTKRNDLVEKETGVYRTDDIKRLHCTFLCFFQYMIGNTDWSITGRHNIKLVVPKKDTFSTPLAVPYDFDYAGIVNAPYAIPSERLEITSVRERLYRGHPRTPEEVEGVAKEFRIKKDTLLSIIQNFSLLPDKAKKDMLNYLDKFFEILESESSMRKIFIQYARKY